MSPQQRAAIAAVNSAASELIAEILSDKFTDRCTDFTAHFHLDRSFTRDEPTGTVTEYRNLYRFAWSAAPPRGEHD